ncbi:glycoside hydrolase family 16 protein [Xylaria bambusicola]|uniref:glycoside hydrolase family 16 protein n=1 Tax=Xylaria bambusicola TaxID=326684 RepID=UPI0020073462|nr:glycoside hydrolase family 16 protein [Xylaria bambusicola]KAI0526255.1 glycoside hydrolase family 16 protein [Xylaria bambusicola]
MAGLSLQTLFFIGLQVLGRVACLEEVSDRQCNCYLTNETSTNYFTTHNFFDFRALTQYANVPSPIADPYDSSDADETSDYFLDKDWTNVWGIQRWNNSDSVDSGDVPVLLVNSPNNIYIQENTDENPSSETFLTMRTMRYRGYQSAAEFESISKAYHFLSVRMYARTLGPPGAVTAMFTYRDDGDGSDLTTVQESDLEIRTQDPKDKVQYTNQPSYNAAGYDIPQSTRNVTTPIQADWTQWSIHRMDWTPKDTTWYIDGRKVASIAFQVPRDPSQVIFNAWSDGGEWSGNMTVGSEAYLQIQWIEMVYNTTGDEKTTDKRDSDAVQSLWNVKRAEEGCQNICSIDETPTVGTPVLLQGAASRMSDHVLGFGVAYVWIPLLLATFLI